MGSSSRTEFDQVGEIPGPQAGARGRRHLHPRQCPRPDPAARAIVKEREATMVVGPDAGFTIDRHFNLVTEIDADAAHGSERTPAARAAAER